MLQTPVGAQAQAAVAQETHVAPIRPPVGARAVAQEQRALEARAFVAAQQTPVGAAEARATVAQETHVAPIRPPVGARAAVQEQRAQAARAFVAAPKMVAMEDHPVVMALTKTRVQSQNPAYTPALIQETCQNRTPNPSSPEATQSLNLGLNQNLIPILPEEVVRNLIPNLTPNPSSPEAIQSLNLGLNQSLIPILPEEVVRNLTPNPSSPEATQNLNQILSRRLAPALTPLRQKPAQTHTECRQFSAYV